MASGRSLVWMSTVLALISGAPSYRTLHHPPAPATDAAVTTRAPGATPAPRRGRPGAVAPLPDSVLVRIDGRRDVTRGLALRRWREEHPATPADSITPAAVHQFFDLLIDDAVLTRAAVREAAPWSPADSADH